EEDREVYQEEAQEEAQEETQEETQEVDQEEDQEEDREADREEDREEDREADREENQEEAQKEDQEEEGAVVHEHEPKRMPKRRTNMESPGSPQNSFKVCFDAKAIGGRPDRATPGHSGTTHWPQSLPHVHQAPNNGLASMHRSNGFIVCQLHPKMPKGVIFYEGGDRNGMGVEWSGPLFGPDQDQGQD
ncbi:GL17649, partial [Drosophila persimilis]